MPWHPTLINSEILSVHAGLVPVGPRGTVLMFGGDEHNRDQGGTDQTPANPANIDRTALFNVEVRTATRTSSPTTDVFCAGQAFLGDGRLLVAGGTESWGGQQPGGPGGGHGHEHGNFGGHQACWIYNHHQNSWSQAADLNFQDGRGGGRWYPSLITLPSGDVVAFGGHPSRRSLHWHENDIPERYSPGANRWTWYPTAVPFEHPVYPGNWYPRISLVRGGGIFITTAHNQKCRFFDPGTGLLMGPVVDPAPSPYNSGWDYSVIQLPLVPEDGFRSRILAVGGLQPHMIELNLAGTPAWGPAGTRQGSAANKTRRYVCPVYLPTGQIIVTGGIDGTVDTNAVKEPEIYTPSINWETRSYVPGQGTWGTIEEPAQVARNYHSVALLLPDGSVFTASSSKDGTAGDPDVVGQKNIELYLPDYFDDPNRPTLVVAPASLNYADNSFTLTAGSNGEAASIRKVALIRCGSVTHAADFDQRYVALAFAHQANTPNLVVEFPNDPSVLPPGNYMVWIVNGNDLPCQVARFVRIAHQSCTVITDRSTFSHEEVSAAGNGGDALFSNAVYVQFDGFIHTELTGTPALSVTWDDTGVTVPAEDFELVPAGRLQEVNPGFADTPQRITFPFHVLFHNLDPYAGFTDTRGLRLTFALGSLTCTQTLDLTYDPNPYLIDIDPASNNPVWLSTDVRVFSIQAGQVKFDTVFQGLDDPIPFIRRCLDKLNDSNQDGEGLFGGLSSSATLDLATTGPWPLSLPIYNYAIARVRYRATTTTAANVKCFFRMFNVAATGLEFDPNTSYRASPGPDPVPLLGTAGGEIVSIPFYASARKETVQGRAGADSMAAQSLHPAYEVLSIAPDATGQEVTVFFGAWLDINQTVKRFPLSPGGGDGPWPEEACRSIQELSRGRHMCVVAELFFQPDETAPGETPGSSDNLSQRNLVILHSENPGGPDSHTVMHTLEVKPSQSLIGAVDIGVNAFGEPSTIKAIRQRYRVDELIFRWHNLPTDSEVTVYFSDIDVADIESLAVFRQSPLAFDVVDRHTLKFRVAGATWVPLPGGRQLNIPALVSIKLPDSVTYGDEYRVSVHQVNGANRSIIGSCEFRIPVSKAELILDEEIRSLSVFSHVLTTIPTDNRWHPLITRYVHHLGLKVRALGGDPDAVHPNPDGSGRPYDPKPRDDVLGRCWVCGGCCGVGFCFWLRGPSHMALKLLGHGWRGVRRLVEKCATEGRSRYPF